MKEQITLKELSAYLPYGLKYYPSENSDLFHDIYADDVPTPFVNYSEALEAEEVFALKLKNSYLIQKEPFIAFDDGELFLGQFESSLGFDVDDVYVSEVRPLLRPLSDLTKEIEHNGERFVPLQKLTEIFGGREIKFDGGAFYVSKFKGHNVEREPHEVRPELGEIRRFSEKWEDEVPMHFSQYDAFQKLLEWHFDLHNLIERGLAIEINQFGQ